MRHLTSTRRRILGGLCGLGLIPAASHAQESTAPPKYTCEVRSGTADGAERTLTTVTGTRSTSITRQSSELTIEGAKPEIFAPLSKSATTPFKAEFSLYNYSGFTDRKAVYPEDIMIRFSGFDYNGVWPENKSPKVKLFFDFGNGRPKSYFAEVNKLETTSNEAYFLFKISNKLYTERDAEGIFDAWDRAGNVVIVVMGLEDNKTWLKTRLYGMNWDGIRDVFNLNYKEAYAKLDAGNCPAAEGCFLTTAAADTVGLDDDCWELQTLRHFRDGPMQKLKGGSDLIKTYYATAPAIVSRINAREDARSIWLSVYIRDIVPAAIFASLGVNSFALRHYMAMMRKLERLAH